MQIRKNILMLSFPFILVTSLNGLGQIKEVVKVSRTFSDFNNAVEKKDAIEALKYVTDSSKIYFSHIFSSTKNITPDSHTTSAADKEVIDWLETIFIPRDTANLQENEVLNFIISHGAFVRLNLERFHPGAITINDESANALLTTFSSDEKTNCLFKKENKKWKLDLIFVVRYLVQTLH